MISEGYKGDALFNWRLVDIPYVKKLKTMLSKKVARYRQKTDSSTGDVSSTS